MKTEFFRKFRWLDYIGVLILSLLWVLITWLVNLPNTEFTFMFSLFLTSLFMVFTSFLIRKSGAVVLFCVLCGIIGAGVNNLGGLGWNKLIVLVVVGIIFEIFSFFVRFEFKNIPLSVVVGSGFSMMSIPLTMLFLIDAKMNIIQYVWNFALMGFIIGLIGAVIMFLGWYHIRKLKWILKFQYHV
jgi:uncharacterized membrane protein